MAAAAKLCESGLAYFRLRAEPVQEKIMGRKKPGKVLAAEFGGLYSLLQRHAEYQAVQQELKLPLILLISAHASEGQPGFSAFLHQGRADCRPWPLERRHKVGMVGRSEITIGQS